MSSMSKTLARLTSLSRGGRESPMRRTRLIPLEKFGSNPGALGGWYYIPHSAPVAPALVVVLHGCTQNAADYDHGSGWSELADEQGFALLFPEQQRSNNANLCFNWFEPGDNRRDAGEPLSIRQMIGAMIERHGADPGRVYISGLSAGGAMTSVMLATHPDVFAAGAIIAGLPYGTATGISEALARMRGQPRIDGSLLAKAVLDASPHRSPWPRISVWHGSADHVVHPSNSDAILAQWLTLHGAAAPPSEATVVDGQTRRVWRNADGVAVIEDFRIVGMGHGTPLATTGNDRCGASGPHMLEAAISSTRHIADFWGLADRRANARQPLSQSPPVTDVAPPPASSLASTPTRSPSAPPPGGTSTSGVGKVIEDALRAAGLMR